jgi:DNA-binding XRE family transcriptional regulator
MRKQATVVAADAWLDGVIHHSPAFHAQVEAELAAINVAQDLVALRESRGLSQAQLARRVGVTRSAIAQLESAQPDNIELSTLVRCAAALGAHVDVSIRPGRRAGRQSCQLARPTATKPS